MKSLAALLLAFCIVPAFGASCADQAKVLKKESGPVVEALKKWLGSGDPSIPAELAQSAQYLKEVTIVDADNDGKAEYVITRSEGSGGYLSLDILAPAEKGFRVMGDIPWPTGMRKRDGGWYSHGFRNPLSDEVELFTEVCGKVYLSFAGNEGSPGRNSYLWAGGETRKACDKNWIAYSRALFRKIRDTKKPADAAKFLKSVLAQCDHDADPAEVKSMTADLAAVEKKQ